MIIGKLRRSVTIQQDNGSDSTGEWIPIWGTFKQVKAEKVPEQGNESDQADQIVAQERNRWTIRYLSGVTANMRIQDSNQYHYITSVEDHKEKRMMILHTYQKDNE